MFNECKGKNLLRITDEKEKNLYMYTLCLHDLVVCNIFFIMIKALKMLNWSEYRKKKMKMRKKKKIYICECSEYEVQ